MLSTLIFTAAFAAADLPPIEAMAPETTFFVVTAKDLNATWNTLRAGQFGKLYDDPKSKEALGDAPKELEDALEQAAKDLGIERKDLVLPGRIGAAFFSQRDEELDASTTEFFIVADFDERADSGERLLRAAFEKGAKDDGVTIEKADLDGTEVWVLPLGSEEAEEVDEMDDGVAIGMELGAFSSGPEALYLMRDGEHMLFATSMAGLEDLRDSSRGKPSGKTLADSDDWRGNAALLGDTDLSATLLIAPVQEMMGATMMGPMAMVQPAIAALFGDVRTVSFGLSAQAKDGIVSASGAAYIPGKKEGLIGLVSKGQAVAPPPKALGDDCITYASYQVAFGDLWKTVEAVVASLPEMQAEQLAPTLTAYEPIMTKALAVMGPAVHMCSWADPKADSGAGSVTSVACSSEKDGMPMLQMFAPSIGMMPRDFQGATIFSGDIAPMAVGLGSGQLVFGQTACVEQALRAASDKDAKGLADSAIYRRCVTALPKGVFVGWGFTDTAAAIDAQKQALERLGDLQGGMDGFVDDAGNPIDEIVPDEAIESAKDMAAKLDAELMKKYIGPSVWWVVPSEKGFSFRGRLMMP